MNSTNENPVSPCLCASVLKNRLQFSVSAVVRRAGAFAFAALVASALFADDSDDADDTAAPTLAGARLPVAAYSSADGCVWTIQTPFLPRGKSSSSETGSGSATMIRNWIDVGTPRTLTGVMFKPRAAASESVDIAWRWNSFRLWGADAPGPYTGTEGMELITSNYLGFAKTVQTDYNALTNYLGISAHRYYFLDNNHDGRYNFAGLELWSDSPSIEAIAPTETDAAAGDYLFTGTVRYLPDGAVGEVCVCVAAEDFGGDYSAWAANGSVFGPSSGLSAGDSYSVAVTGVASGRRYAREFVRVAGDGNGWFTASYTWQLAARGELATPRAYIADTADSSTGLLKSSAYVVYDGKNTGSWSENPTFDSITFALDPSQDYALLRFYPRDSGVNSNFDLWGRVHDVMRIEVSKDTDADWSTAVKDSQVTERDLWRVAPDAVPELSWTTLTNATWTIRTMPNYSGQFVDVILDRRQASRARWLRVVRAKWSSQGNVFNCKEVELYTVKRAGFHVIVR